MSESADRYGGLFGWVRWLYDWTEDLARSRYSLYLLVIVAAAESIFFPIPVDVLLIALCVGRPRRSLFFAGLCTIGSVAGAVGGYAIGYWMWYATGTAAAAAGAAGSAAAHGAATPEFSSIAQFFFETVPGFSEERFFRVQELYRQYEFWAIFTAGFTPLPYKVFTVTAGVFSLPLHTFLIASLLSRAGRFFLVGGLFMAFGARIKSFVDRYLEALSVAFVVLLIGGFVVLKYIL